jgi:hypothetical protein
LSGEISKQGHPIIRPIAPDLVFHRPGEMDNLVVVEVKPVNAALNGILKDLETLTYFVSPEVNYQLGIELVYGEDEGELSRFEQAFRKVGHPQLQLLWHWQPGEPARRIL